MPPRPLLKKPPKPPDVPLRRSKAPGWFELAAQTLGGALGIPPLSAEDYDTAEGGRAIDRAGTLGELLSMGAGGMILGTALKGGKAAAGTLGAAMGKRVPNPIKAYHGSPHDFDQFSMSKIGTGEGAQAYGHGLYFAEAEGTAKAYRDQVRNMPEIDRINKRLSEIANEMEQYKKPGSYREFKDTRGYELADEYDRLMAEKTKAGKLYEVNIHATPDELLDWDKPLSEQPAKVREAANQEFRNVQPVQVKPGWYSVTRVDKDGVGRTMTSEILESSPEAAMQRFDEYLNSERGENLIRRMGEPAKASASLREAGIKGIQYLDQGSRGGNVDRWLVKSSSGMVRDFGTEAEALKAMEKIPGATLTRPNVTRNFVIFDDELIEIAKKYGIPLTTAASLVEQQGGTVETRP